jgi:hypothetical protein
MNQRKLPLVCLAVGAIASGVTQFTKETLTVDDRFDFGDGTNPSLACVQGVRVTIDDTGLAAGDEEKVRATLDGSFLGIKGKDNRVIWLGSFGRFLQRTRPSASEGNATATLFKPSGKAGVEPVTPVFIPAGKVQVVAASVDNDLTGAGGAATALSIRVELAGYRLTDPADEAEATAKVASC